VLRITRITRMRRMPSMKLEGELLEAWVNAVREACVRNGRGFRRMCLDLTAVTYVDAAGTQLLRELIDDGIEISACSKFVGHLLQLEGD
jgi:anti-anti-sigma regulatory factor